MADKGRPPAEVGPDDNPRRGRSIDMPRIEAVGRGSGMVAVLRAVGEATIVKLSPSTRYVLPTCGESPEPPPREEDDLALRNSGVERRLASFGIG